MAGALAALAVASVIGLAGRSPHAAANDRQLQIVGGGPAQPQPWMVAIGARGRDLASGQFCGGSLIAPEWVVTAAHCVASATTERPENLRLVIGRHDLREGDGDDNLAAQVIRHPNYSASRLERDIALIRLVRPSTQPTIALPAAGDESLTVPSAPVSVFGWGQLNDDKSNRQYPYGLRTAAVPVLADGVCDNTYAVYISNEMVCAGSPGVSACFGDSGGPLVATNPAGAKILVGVVSFGSSVCSAAPSVYSQTSAFVDWVRSIVPLAAAPKSTSPTPSTTVPPAATPALPEPVDVIRLAGTDRVATAVGIAQAAFPDGTAGGAVLASAESFADALVGAPLATANGGPLLLVPGSGITPELVAELTRATGGGATVYVLGGTNAVPASVDATLTDAGFRPVRLAGADRYATAVRVAEALGSPTTVIEASGSDAADALVAGAAAAHTGSAVLLTAGRTLPAATIAYLERRPEVSRVAVGAAAAAADPTAEAIVGQNRYETATLAAIRFHAGPATAGVAGGDAFADALAGAAHAARVGGPLLLTSPGSLPAATADYLRANAATIGKTFVYGGSGAVAGTVLGEIQAAIS